MKDTPSKNQILTKSERLKETQRRRRRRVGGSRAENGISVIAESPERKTKFTAANPNLSISQFLDTSHNSSLFQRALSGLYKVWVGPTYLLIQADSSMMNKSSLDLFSPPKSKKHVEHLLFGSGSEDLSSEEEAIGVKDSILYSPPYKR